MTLHVQQKACHLPVKDKICLQVPASIDFIPLQGKDNIISSTSC